MAQAADKDKLLIKLAFSEALRRLRSRRKLTQEQLAASSGISLRYLQDLETGSKMASITTVFQLSRALETSPQSLLKPAWKQWLTIPPS